ncbi:hypothetical protein ACFX11_034348 [Malus domestica]
MFYPYNGTIHSSLRCPCNAISTIIVRPQSTENSFVVSDVVILTMTISEYLWVCFSFYLVCATSGKLLSGSSCIYAVVQPYAFCPMMQTHVLGRSLIFIMSIFTSYNSTVKSSHLLFMVVAFVVAAAAAVVIQDVPLNENESSAFLNLDSGYNKIRGLFFVYIYYPSGVV